MTFCFRHRFELADVKLHADVHEIVLAESTEDERVTLSAPGLPDAVITKSDQLVLSGCGYLDHGKALEAAVKWRQFLTDAFASQAISVDFGDESGSTRAGEWIQDLDPPDYLTSLGFQKGDRMIVDDVRLLIYEADPPPKFTYGEAFAPTLAIGPEGLLARLAELGARTYVPWTSGQELAYKLIHSSLRDTNPDTRFIQLATAVEALLPGAKRPPEILKVLDELDSIVKDRRDLDPQVQKRVSDILTKAKDESIAQEAAKLVSIVRKEYDSKTPKAFFSRAYTFRCGLVHGSTQRLSPAEYGKLYANLLDLVRDVLETYSPLTEQKIGPP